MSISLPILSMRFSGLPKRSDQKLPSARSSGVRQVDRVIIASVGTNPRSARHRGGLLGQRRLRPERGDLGRHDLVGVTVSAGDDVHLRSVAQLRQPGERLGRGRAVGGDDVVADAARSDPAAYAVGARRDAAILDLGAEGVVRPAAVGADPEVLDAEGGDAELGLPRFAVAGQDPRPQVRRRRDEWFRRRTGDTGRRGDRRCGRRRYLGGGRGRTAGQHQQRGRCRSRPSPSCAHPDRDYVGRARISLSQRMVGSVSSSSNRRSACRLPRDEGNALRVYPRLRPLGAFAP